MTNDIKDVEIRQATADDIKLFYPDGPPRTSYSWLALYRGKPACLAGIIMERGGCIAYSEILPDCDAPKITIWRTARALLDLIKSVGVPVYAMCDPENVGTNKFVERLGFKFNRVYEGVRVYK